MSYSPYTPLSRDSTGTRHFSGFHGIDLSADETTPDPSRFARLTNMWKDWQSDDGQAVETFPGYRCFAGFGGAIYGIFTHTVNGKEYLTVHSGKKLYRFPSSMRNHPADIRALSPLTSSLPEEAGCAFQVGDTLYLLIGGFYAVINAAGEYRAITANGADAYVPLTYYNGAPYEQQNLLTDKVRERYSGEALEETEILSYSDFVFTVLDAANKTCAVSGGTRDRGATTIRIPASADINGTTYTVTAIESGGFMNFRRLLSLSLPQTLCDIGPYAFYGCKGLTELSVPASVKTIGKQAFAQCISLQTVNLYKGLTSIGEGAFFSGEGPKDVNFSGTALEFAQIDLGDELPFPETTTFHYEVTIPAGEIYSLRVPIFTPATAVSSVAVGTSFVTADIAAPLFDATASYSVRKSDGKITEILLHVSDKSVFSGRNVTVTLTAAAPSFSLPGEYAPFTSGATQSAFAAVCGCKAACEFDGRIFLTGNPAFPNTVFYSAPDDTGYNNPLYFGNLNYFNDGLSTQQNKALLSAGSMLMVIKGDTAGEGSVYYHTAQSTEYAFLPRVYPAESGVAGIGAAGCAVNFLDDPVFLTRGGLMAVKKEALNRERALVARSSHVNLALCREKLSEAVAAVFEGYLFLLTNGTVYLADSRETFHHSSGGTEYEWYRLEGIGSFTGDRPLYRYAESLPEGAGACDILLSPKGGEAVSGTVYTITGHGITFYYTVEGGVRYAVDWDGERTGGQFCPANRLCAGTGALYFGTPDGSLCCFNTDKRGKRLYRTVKGAGLFRLSGEEYVALDTGDAMLHSEEELTRLSLYRDENGEKTMVGTFPLYVDGGAYRLAEPLCEKTHPGRIPGYYYSFAGHAFLCGCATKMDNAGIPHLSKNTIPRSGVLRVKITAPTAFTVSVRTDLSGFGPVEKCRTNLAGFEGTDFSAFSFGDAVSLSLPLREKERRWTAKQYEICADVFRSPFGVYGLSYSFRTAGRIRT